MNEPISYHQKAIKCGKLGCKRCPHGPYWYSMRWVAGKPRWKYVGKHLPEGITVSKPVMELQVFPPAMTVYQACQILGFGLQTPYRHACVLWGEKQKRIAAMGDEGKAQLVQLNAAFKLVQPHLP